MEWFNFNDRWHALKGQTEAICGLKLVIPPETSTFDLYPTNPCHSCRMAVAMADVEEETVADVLARGHIPVPFAAETADEPPST